MKNMTRAFLLAGCLTLGLSGAAQAAENHVKAMKSFGENTVKQWIAEPIFAQSIMEQNGKHATLSQSQIDSLDIQWRTETVLSSKPLINQLMGHPLSKHLEKLQEETKGVVTEIFVMDNKGLNVGQSEVTSDYWQGDEWKWQKTFLVGADAVFIDEVEHDASTDSFQSQLSMSITDPKSGQVIGAVTVGINVDLLLAAGM